MGSRTVLLFGQSLLLGVVAEALRQCADLRIAQVANWGEASGWLERQVPDVLIFDLPEAGQSPLMPLLLENPHMLMIGLDTECSEGVVVSGQQARALTLSQIREIATTGAHP